jgi:hypothetical protein
MRKLFLSILTIATIAMAPSVSALTLSNETLNYQIVYHWGVVWKHAGDATLSVSKSGSGYNARLTGKTRSWADKIYTVRDTLKCSMLSNFRPVKYEKFTHENSYYAHDIVAFNSSGSGTTAACTRYRKNKPTANINLSHGGAAYDMLSVFYLLRSLDYQNMAANKVYKTCVFSGKEKETLTIKYVGIKPLQLRDKSRHQAFHLKLSFTTDNGKKSSDDIDAYISTDAQRIPLLVVGKLKIGEIKCYYAK